MKREFEVENRLTAVETKLEEISTNHLPHIQGTLDKLLWLLITNLVGLVILFGTKFLK